MAKPDQVLSNISASKYELLRSLVIDNIEHFRQFDSKKSTSFVEIFSPFLASLNAVELEIKDLASVVHIYDLDANTPGNGYRSIIDVVDKFVLLSIKLCQDVIHKRNRFAFSQKSYVRQVSEYNRVLEALLAVVRISQTLRLKNEPGTLFSLYDAAFIQRIMMDIEKVDRASFFGNLNFFQFHESLKASMIFITRMTASFSHVYFSSGGVIPRIFEAMASFCRYSHNQTKLSKRFVKVLNSSTPSFCKTFWNLQNHIFVKKISKTTKNSLAINKLLKLQPEPVQLCKADGTLVDIPIPSSHTPIAPVPCLLLSANAREGQLDVSERMQHPPDELKAASPYLIIYVHMGGYLAGPSALHQDYINQWAERLDAPILCVHHSLAPEAPYPRPLEDCFYAYAWAIQNAHRLGSTGEKICLAGCSAGGDLITCVTIKAIQLGIRKPDYIFAVCPANSNRFLPAPAYLLSLMDPILPLEFIFSCVGAYIGNAEQTEQVFAERSIEDEQKLHVRTDNLITKADNDPIKSACLVSDNDLAQFPPMRIVSCHLDPFVDNVVSFLKRAKHLGVDVGLDLLENLVHGFLAFASVSQPAHEGCMLCIQRIQELLQMPPQHGIS